MIQIESMEWSREASVPDENGDLISLFQHNRLAVRVRFVDGKVILVVFPKGSGTVPEANYHLLARSLAHQARAEGKEIFHA